MTNTMVCTFCKNKGIPTPHNHTVRNWTLPNKPIICPQLLSTQCTYCKLFGHTRQYCPVKHAETKCNTMDMLIDETKNNLKRELDFESESESITNKAQKT